MVENLEEVLNLRVIEKFIYK